MHVRAAQSCSGEKQPDCGFCVCFSLTGLNCTASQSTFRNQSTMASQTVRQPSEALSLVADSRNKIVNSPNQTVARVGQCVSIIEVWRHFLSGPFMRSRHQKEEKAIPSIKQKPEKPPPSLPAPFS
jgi:hypothetical protein